MDLELLDLAVRLASVPLQTKKTVERMLKKLFEAVQSNKEDEEMASLSDVEALSLTMHSASRQLADRIKMLRAKQIRVHEEVVALEKECRELDRQQQKEYAHFQTHEAALLAKNAEVEANKIREGLIH